MTRTATDATKAQIAALGNSNGHPPWLRAAMHDAAMGRPMSLERERRVCAALGIAPPVPRRRYYRPCLPVDLGEQVKLWNIDVEALLTQAVKSAIVDEQWRERVHEA